MSKIQGKLILKGGAEFSGLIPEDQQGTFPGEVVFNTGMVGYVEALTDPSYAGQILVFTYPLIGNYGVSEKNQWESNKIQVAGVVVAQMASFYAHKDATMSLPQWLRQQGIPFITDVDTRALTKVLRTQGVVPGAITSEALKDFNFQINTTNWVEKVSITTPEEYGEGPKKVIVVDCGIKENILRNLLNFPIKIKRVPYNYDFTKEDFDGVFISNGPGDPQDCTETVAILQKALEKKKPTFGICLGNQLMALAIGAKTYKLYFGHRSQNQPCLETASGQYFLTSQNHGYAVDEKTLPKDWNVSFRNIHDNTVAGIAHEKLPFFAVQFHPEAAPGPVDTEWLFEKFYKML